MKIDNIDQIVKGLTITILQELLLCVCRINGTYYKSPFEGNVKYPVTVTITDVEEDRFGKFFTNGEYGRPASSVIDAGAVIMPKDKRFPFQLKKSEATLIARLCIENFQEVLTNKWGSKFFLEDTIQIQEKDYKELRVHSHSYKLTTLRLNLDKVFGKDCVHPVYNKGDLIFVKETKEDDCTWNLRYYDSYEPTLDMVRCYDNQKKEGHTFLWKHHHPCNAVLPD